MMRRMYSTIFARHRTPYCAEVVEDGTRAIALIERTEYDLVITDLSMPVVDGRSLYLLAQQVCTKEYRNAPPFLFCSAVTTALDTVAEFCGSYANRLMLKPFSLAQLSGIVHEMTANN